MEDGEIAFKKEAIPMEEDSDDKAEAGEASQDFSSSKTKAPATATGSRRGGPLRAARDSMIKRRAACLWWRLGARARARNRV